MFLKLDTNYSVI